MFRLKVIRRISENSPAVEFSYFKIKDYLFELFISKEKKMKFELIGDNNFKYEQFSLFLYNIFDGFRIAFGLIDWNITLTVSQENCFLRLCYKNISQIKIPTINENIASYHLCRLNFVISIELEFNVFIQMRLLTLFFQNEERETSENTIKMVTTDYLHVMDEL